MSRCPACDTQLVPWRRVQSVEPSLRVACYELWRCPACGTARTMGQAPDALHESGAYRPGAPRLHGLVGPVLTLFDRQRLRLLRDRVPPPAKLLDAGAGRGRFVGAARAAGYEASGIEPSSRGVSAAHALGLPVTQVSIEDAQLPAGAYDVVTLWHVLEHVEDPGAVLERIRSWLAPGGVLVMGVPNLASVQARLGGERWYHLDIPRHRTHFTPNGVQALLRRCGFDVAAAHHVLLEHNPFGMWQSLVSHLTRHPSYLYNLLKRNAPARSRDLGVTLAALPLAPVAGALELAAGLARRGGTVAVVARVGARDEE